MSDTHRERMLALEYEKLKEEQIVRISTRDNLVYAAIASIGASIGFGWTRPEAQLVFFVLPMVVFALGWTYLSNDLKITTIGRYLKKASSDEFGPDAFGWEAHHLKLKGRRRRKMYQLLVDLGIFPGAGFLSAFYALSLGDLNWAKTGLSVVGLALSCALAFEFTRSSPLVDADGLN